MKPEYTSSLPASPLPYGFKRLGLALCYMLIQVTVVPVLITHIFIQVCILYNTALQVVGSIYLPSNWPGSESFQQSSLLLRFLLLPLWVKIVLSKYIFAWLLAESVCVFSGLSFVEKREDGSVDWRGCANVKVHR